MNEKISIEDYIESKLSTSLSNEEIETLRDELELTKEVLMRLIPKLGLNKADIHYITNGYPGTSIEWEEFND